MSALKYWLWLTTRKGLGADGALTVLDCFQTPERAYYADREEYEQLPLQPSQIRGLTDKSMDGPEKILADCQRLDVRIMTLQDADYPQRLRQIADPPAVLYIRGRVLPFDEKAAIAVVGTRQPTAYGEGCAARFGMELTAGGALVVSGMAEGLDACAIRGALKAGGPVVSVLAGGVDVPFPPQHRFLYEDVASVGALISEYPPGMPHIGHHFPRRNRILSGLALGVLAVECRPYSGTMITVNHALEQDRDVFAIPGPLDAPMSQGPNLLIRQGARLVTCGGDILDEYRDRFPELKQHSPLEADAVRERLDEVEHQQKLHPRDKEHKPPAQSQQPERETVARSQQKERFTDDELALLHALGSKSRTVDELVELSQTPTRRVLSALTMLQVSGAVEEKPGRRFVSCVTLEE